MRLFECQNCGSVVYFNNTACVNCGYRLGYIAEKSAMSALEQIGETWTALADPGKPYIFCSNAADGVCNWLVAADSGATFCQACRHNRTIPDLTIPAELDELVEARGRQAPALLFPHPMAPADARPNRGSRQWPGVRLRRRPESRLTAAVEKNLTGHADGVITMNIAEADDAEREHRRAMMHEPYRTLLGHFRHEIGHYYWDHACRCRRQDRRLPGGIRRRDGRLQCRPPASLQPGPARPAGS